MQGTPILPLEERHAAGRLAFASGLILLVPVVVLPLAQYFFRGGDLHPLVFLPVLGLLAAYWVIGGAIQWATGRGGIQIRPGNSFRRFALTTVAASFLLYFVLLGLAP